MLNPESQSIFIEQKIFQGFAGLAGMEKSKIGLSLADAKLLKKEQDILYKAVEAYSGLVFANEKLKINQNNINLLERQVETDQARLERGTNYFSRFSSVRIFTCRSTSKIYTS